MLTCPQMKSVHLINVTASRQSPDHGAIPGFVIARLRLENAG